MFHTVYSKNDVIAKLLLATFDIYEQIPESRYHERDCCFIILPLVILVHELLIICRIHYPEQTITKDTQSDFLPQCNQLFRCYIDILCNKSIIATCLLQSMF